MTCESGLEGNNLVTFDIRVFSLFKLLSLILADDILYMRVTGALELFH